MKNIAKNLNIFFLLVLFISCNTKEKKNVISESEAIRIEKEKSEGTRTEINCDSVYKNKGYTIVLETLNYNTDYDTYKVIFSILKNKQGKKNEIFRDTIESTVGDVGFSDYNNDGIKDILIQNISDVRSNWTYNLYLVNLKKDTFQKVKGFEQIKNPRYLPKYNLIDNEVMSGREWTSFYQIQNDTIHDFGYVIEKGMNEDGTYVDFDKEYKTTLQKVLKDKHYR